MRVCDRHQDRSARDSVHIINDDQRFDLCDECKTELIMYLVSEPKINGARRGRPPKDSATAETTAP